MLDEGGLGEGNLRHLQLLCQVVQGSSCRSGRALHFHQGILHADVDLDKGQQLPSNSSQIASPIPCPSSANLDLAVQNCTLSLSAVELLEVAEQVEVHLAPRTRCPRILQGGTFLSSMIVVAISCRARRCSCRSSSSCSAV